jgi:hypothetical protein
MTAINTTIGRSRYHPRRHTSRARSSGRQPAQPQFLRFEVNHDADGDEKEKSRNRRDLDDLQIRDSGHLRHDEGARAHDGRHDGSAGRRRGLDRARNMAGETGRFMSGIVIGPFVTVSAMGLPLMVPISRLDHDACAGRRRCGRDRRAKCRRKFRYPGSKRAERQENNELGEHFGRSKTPSLMRSVLDDAPQ